MNKRFIVTVLVFSLILLGLIRLGKERLERHTFVLMDTYVDFVVDKPHREVIKDLVKIAEDLNHQLSFFEPNSCVSKMNEKGKILKGDECFELMRDLVELSKDVNEKTMGAFDPGFRGGSGIQKVIVSEDGIYIPQDGKYDFSGIAKGYIVDKLIRVAREKGVRFVMVNAGGDVAVWDDRGIGVWVDVANPEGGRLDRVKVVRGAVATSGTYYRGKHIVDPRTKKRVSGLVSASAQSGSCAVADAWATAVFVLGREGLSLAEGNGVGVIIGFLGEGGRIEVVKNKIWKDVVDEN